MNNLVLWLTWLTPSCELNSLDAMNNLGLWMTSATLGGELKALDAINNSELWVIWTTRDPLSLGL